MGLMDRLFGRKDAAAVEPTLSPEEHLMSKFDVPNDFYADNLRRILGAKDPAEISDIAAKVSMVDTQRERFGMRPLDAKETALCIRAQEKGVNILSIGMLPDYASMAEKVNAAVGQMARYRDAPLIDSVSDTIDGATARVSNCGSPGMVGPNKDYFGR